MEDDLFWNTGKQIQLYVIDCLYFSASLFFVNL